MPTSLNPLSLFYGRSLVLGLCLGGVLAVTQAAAYGGGGDSSRTPPPTRATGVEPSSQPTEDQTSCPTGRIWNAKRAACVRMRGESQRTRVKNPGIGVRDSLKEAQ
jgi:hypothetical protein